MKHSVSKLPRMSSGGCPGPSCPGCKTCFAKGGMLETGYEKGINRGRNLEKGVSYAGAHQRGQVFADHQSKSENESDAKDQHRKTLHEMKSMKKPNLYAKGGAVFEKGVHNPSGGNYESGTSMTGIYARGTKEPSEHGPSENASGFMAKLNHKKVLKDLKSMKKPNLYAEGGEVDSDGDMDGDDSALDDAIGEELLNAFETKNKTAILDAIRAVVLSCKE